MRSALRLLAAAGLALAACAPAAAEPPVWRVKGPKGEVTLFGSVHLLQESTRWKSERLRRLLAQADRLMFEIPMDEAAQGEAAARFQAIGRLPAGQTLRPLLSPKGRERLEWAATRLNLTVTTLDRLEPWLAEVILSVSWFARAGAKAEFGVEREIARAAPRAAERAAFESLDDQLAALSGGSRADQVKALEETLKEFETDPGGLDRLARAWARGDVRTIEREGLDELRRDAPGAYGRLVVDRNRRWVKTIEALLNKPGRTFAVVGVGHLVGPDSVPAMLRRDGVAVEGPR